MIQRRSAIDWFMNPKRSAIDWYMTPRRSAIDWYMTPRRSAIDWYMTPRRSAIDWYTRNRRSAIDWFLDSKRTGQPCTCLGPESNRPGDPELTYQNGAGMERGTIKQIAAISSQNYPNQNNCPCENRGKKRAAVDWWLTK